MITDTSIPPEEFIVSTLTEAADRLAAKDDDPALLLEHIAKSREMLVELRALRKALGASNARMADLYAELEEAKEQLEDASRANAHFLRMMNHEIRTPLNGVLGMMELLDATTLVGRQREMLATARSSGESLVRVIDHGFDYVKLVSGQLELDASRFDLRKVFAAVVDPLTAAARAKGVELVSDVRVECDVLGDASRVGQILGIVVGNAVKFTDAGRIEVRLSVEKKAGTAAIELVVTDTGVGITREAMETLFTPFVQADASNTKRFGGTGLGLAIGRRLARLMGGDIRAESKPGEGSTFTFTASLNAFESLGRKTVVPMLFDASAGPPRVLLVDDAFIGREVGIAVLEDLACEVIVAESAGEALDTLEKLEIDLVLMDCLMPEVDGYAAARAIRHLEEVGRIPRFGTTGKPRERVPIIAVTSDVGGETRSRCVEAGMDDLVPKPYSQAALREAMGRWLAA